MGERLVEARALTNRHLSAISETFFVYDMRVGLAGLAVVAVASPRLAGAALFCSLLARFVVKRAGAARALVDSGLVELNGWFLGLAVSTFYPVGLGLALALVFGSTLSAALSIVLHRVLATWDIPLLVGPYVPAFWLVSSALSAFSWGQTVLPPTPPSPASPIVLVLVGGLRGLGEIFFLPNAWVGAALAAAASIADKRLGVAMVGASVASVGIGYVAGAPMWQVEAGLAGFTPALVAVAALRGFAGLGRGAVAVAIVSSPFLEVAAVRLAGVLGLYALSTTYIGLVWTLALLRPVREAAAARSSWSSATRSSGTRPRVFENG